MKRPKLTRGGAVWAAMLALAWYVAGAGAPVALAMVAAALAGRRIP